MSKKKLLSLAVIVIMIAILSMSSLAWFSDSDSVKNEFMIAASDDTTADDIFSVDVWENTPDGTEDQDGHTYEDILPGDVLEKVAVVENTGYYDQYIRMTVTVSDAAAWMEILGTTEAPMLWQIVNGLDNADTWYFTDNVSGAVLDTANDAIVYTLYYRNVLKSGETVTVFEEVKIPTSMTQAQAALFQSNFNITVKAEAVQTENLGIDTSNGFAADDAFAVVEG